MKIIITKIFFIALLFFGLFGMAKSSAAANYYVRPGATGNGSDWTNAYASLSTAMTNVARGNTIYIAGGSYPSTTFDKAASGTSVMTIKKAVASDHGTDTGWNSAYGTTQAVFDTGWVITMSYLVIDGQYAALNSGPTIPSQTATYGIKLNYTGTSAHNGVIDINSSSNVTIMGVHVYSYYRSSMGNYDIRSSRVYNSSYVAYYNCFFDGSATDQLAIAGGSHFLADHCFFLDGGQRKAGSPDNHGQTIYDQGMSDAIIRWSIFKNCEGQALWSSDDAQASRLRLYGNVIFNSSDDNYSDGFNSSGGIMQTQTQANEAAVGVYVYNNTIINQPANSPGSGETNYATYVNYGNLSSQWYVYNLMEYACSRVGVGQGTIATGYWATGGGTNPAVSNQQTGITTSYFQNYAGYDFRLTQHTNPGLSLTAQSWWSSGADSFFGTTDSALDMAGNVRSNWDRGAFEYSAGGGDTTPPAAPSGLAVG